MGLHFGAAQPPKSGSRSLQGTLEHSGPLARTAGALVLAPSIHRGVLPCVLSAADGATHVARAAAVFRARNVWGGYFFDMEEVMDTHIAKRNFKLYGEALTGVNYFCRSTTTISAAVGFSLLPSFLLRRSHRR